MIVSAQLVICAALIFFCADRLTRLADVLAEKFNMSRSWIGIVILAAITSLPELSNSLSSVTIVKVPDLGVGNLVGACLMNLLLLSFLDYLFGDRPIFSRLDLGHILTASFAVLLLALTSLGILLSSKINPHLVILLILLVYLIAQRLIFIFEKGKELASEKKYEKKNLGYTLIKFVFFGSIVVVSGIWLSTLGDKIAFQTGWGATFVGSLILSFITTLPELTVSFSAMRLGAPDMAASNLLGSILFNIAILTILDPFSRNLPLLASISDLHVITALAGIICLCVVIIGIVKHSENKLFLRFSWSSLLIILTVFSSWYLLFMIRKV